MLEALTKDVIHVAQAMAPSLVAPYVVQLENMCQAQRRLFVSLVLRTPTEILSVKPSFIADIGLEEHLSPTRKNGLGAMLQSIKQRAELSSNKTA